MVASSDVVEAKYPAVLKFTSSQIQVSPEVAEALRRDEAVVALESTIIAHGMPHPQNLHTAQALEKAVRANGATPATVAVLHGIPHVGLSAEQLQLLASPSAQIRKLARRDLPLAYARGEHGATTVSATMAISRAVGVRVFATGGIGGVHRGVAATWDVSADIGALAEIPQLVVCAGAKSLLDVPKTLEALESASVPVLVLQHNAFPAFYTRGTLPAPSRVDTESEAARVFYAGQEAECSKGMLLAVPVPREYEADTVVVEEATLTALQELDAQRPPVLPAQVTPFLLKRVAELTKGASLTANMYLAKNNAVVAARVAVELSALRASTASVISSASIQEAEQNSSSALCDTQILVVGGVGVDIHCDASQGTPLQLGVSNRGIIRQCVGGVAKNMAEAASGRGQARVTLVSGVGADAAGAVVVAWLRRAGLDVSGVKTFEGKRTGTCCIVHDEKGDLAVAVGDWDDIHGDKLLSLVAAMRPAITTALLTAKLVLLDGNLPPHDLRALASLCHAQGTPCWYEPTTPQKAGRIVQADVLAHMAYLSPNETELLALGQALPDLPQSRTVHDLATHVLTRGGGGARGQVLFVTRGKRGVWRFRVRSGRVEQTVFEAARVRVRNTTGAGDCFAGVCAAALVRGVTEDEAVRIGVRAAGECCADEGIGGGGRARM